MSATVAPYSGLVVETASDAVGRATTVTVVEADLLVSSLEVAVMTTLPGVAGAVQAPVLALIVPPVADQVSPLVRPPVAVVEKVVALLTVRLGAAGVMGATATVCGVTVTETSAAWPPLSTVCSQ